MLSHDDPTHNIHSAFADEDCMDCEESPSASTPDWFEHEAHRYEEMGSPLGAFMACCVREIARDFAAFDTEDVEIYLARRATYTN